MAAITPPKDVSISSAATFFGEHFDRLTRIYTPGSMKPRPQTAGLRQAAVAVCRIEAGAAMNMNDIMSEGSGPSERTRYKVGRVSVRL